MKTGKRRLAVALLASLSAVLLALILYFLIVPLDLSRYDQRIETFIESRTGRHIDLNTIIIKVLPSPKITLKDVTVFHEEQPIFSSASVETTLRLWPLFTKNVLIEDLRLGAPRLFVRRGPDGSTNVRGFIEAGKKEEPEKDGFKLKITSIAVDGGHLRFSDELPPAKALFELSDINASVTREGNERKYAVEGRLLPETKVSASGAIDAKGDITGNAAIKPIDLSRLSPYMDMRSAGSSLEGEASVQLAYSLNQGLNIRSNTSYKDLKLNYPTVLNGTLASKNGSGIITITRGESLGIAVDDAELDFTDFVLKGSFALSGPSGSKTIALNLSSTPVPLKTLKDLAPMKVLPPMAKKIVASVKPRAGRVEVKQLAFEGGLSDFKGKGALDRINLVFGAGLEGLRFGYEGFGKEFSDITGEFVLKDRGLVVKGLKGRYGKDLVKALRGSVKGLTGAGAYDFRTEGVLDVAETLELADKALKNRPNIRQRLSKADAGGTVDIAVNVKGALKGERPIAYSGTALLDGGRLSYEGMPVSLEGLSGDFAFDNKRVDIKGLRASDGFSELGLKGYVEDYSTGAPYADVSAESRINGGTIEGLLKNRPLGEELFIGGGAPVKAWFKGTRKSFSSSVSVDAAPARIAYKDYVRKEEDYPASFEAAFDVQGSELTIKKSSLSFGSSSLSLTGLVTKGLGAYSVAARSEGLQLEDLDDMTPFFSKEYSSSGALTFDVSAEKTSSAEAPSIVGAAKLTGGRFQTPYLGSPVEEISASSVFEGNRAGLTVDGMKIGTSIIIGKVDIPDIANRLVRFELTSPRLDTRDIFPKRGPEAEQPERQEPRQKPFTGSGVIKITEGIAWGHPFNAFSTEVELLPELIHVRPISVSADKGQLTGAVTFFRNPVEPALFESRIEASNIDLSSVTASFGAKDRIISGQLRGVLDLSGRRGAEPFTAGLNGRASLTSEKGRLWKFPILAGVFSIVNIVSIDELFQEGLQYKTLEGDFDMKDGIISTEDLSFDSDSMRMSAYGEISLPDARIDTVLALHPFVTIDKIISNIPLAGWIITGKEESAVSLLFKIEGPLKDPEIKPLPVKSVSESVLGMFERLLRTPLRLFREEKK